MLRLRLSQTGSPAAGFQRLERALATRLGAAAVRVNRSAVGVLRGDVKRAGLGERFANTWRAKTYPVSNPSRTLNPAVQIYSNADYLVKAYEEAGVIRHKGGRFLAIPTENVKAKKDGKRVRKMTIEEVEALYGQKMTFIPAKSGRVVVGYIDKGLRRRTTNWKKRGAKGDAPTVNPNRLIAMFYLVRQVRLQKRLNVAWAFAVIKASWSTEVRAAVSSAANS